MMRGEESVNVSGASPCYITLVAILASSCACNLVSCLCMYFDFFIQMGVGKVEHNEKSNLDTSSNHQGVNNSKNGPFAILCFGENKWSIRVKDLKECQHHLLNNPMCCFDSYLIIDLLRLTGQTMHENPVRLSTTFLDHVHSHLVTSKLFKALSLFFFLTHTDPIFVTISISPIIV